ncbi:MAG: hypothetical protein WD749_10225 [Phycisphaerales bacterium]
MLHHRVLSTASLAGLPLSAVAQPVAFYDLGPSFVWAASSDGGRAVGKVNGNEAFQWTPAAGIVPLPGPAGPLGGDPFAISADDSTIVGGAWAPIRAFRVTQAGYQSLGAPAGASYQDVRAVAVSANGASALCSTRRSSGEYQAFLHTDAAGFQPITPLSTAFLWAHAMTPDAQSVVGVHSNRAFRWTQQTGLLYIDGPWNGVSFVSVYGLSADGGVLVGQGRLGAGPVQAARFSSGVVQLLGDLPGGSDSSVAYSVSADGQIVTGLSSALAGSAGFVWDPENGMRDLRMLLLQRGASGLAAWPRLGSQGVSADGRTFFGTGTAPDGTSHGWVAKLAPCGYANCDGSTTAPELNVADFGCFLARYSQGCSDPAACYANCDGSTAAPFLNVADFGCFLQRYAEGCRTP